MQITFGEETVSILQLAPFAGALMGNIFPVPGCLDNRKTVTP